MPIPRRAVVPALLLCLAACRGENPGIHELRTTRVRHVETSVSAPFGGDVMGQAIWLSRGGRIALVYLIDHDTDGNGRLEADFGTHGEPWADVPRLWAFDLESGTAARYDELLELDPTDRYAALRVGGRYVLLDARTGVAMDLAAWGISGADDTNRCLPPRQLGFDGEGRRMAFLRGTPPRLVVRDLQTGAEREVRADSGVLWRGGFGPEPDWVRLDVVDVADGDSIAYPERFSSCASRSAMPFASSYSFGPWQGPPFRSELVPPRGSRVTVPGLARMVGTGAYALRDTALRTADGRPVELPAGCHHPMTVFDGAPTVLLRCGERSVLFDPATRRRIALPVQAWTDEEDAVVDAEGSHWAAVLLDVGPASETMDRPPEYRLARLRLEDATIEAGPRVQSVEVSAGRWAGAHDGSTAYALDLRTGRLLAYADTAGLSIHWGLAWGESGPVVMVDRERARSYPVRETADAASPDGCVLEAAHPSDSGRLVRGPWRRRCPR